MTGREVVRALAVEQVEGDGEQRLPPVVAVGVHGRAVGVGRGNRVQLRDRRSVPSRRRGETHSAGHVGIAVEAEMQRADAAAPGRAAREQHRGLVGIGARLDEQRAGERRIEGFRQARGEAELRRVEIDRARVGQGAEALAHGFGHARVVVTQRRAHLARVEVEIGLTAGIEDLGAGGADEDRTVGSRHHVRQQLALDQMARAGGAQGRDVHLDAPSWIQRARSYPGFLTGSRCIRALRATKHFCEKDLPGCKGCPRCWRRDSRCAFCGNLART